MSVVVTMKSNNYRYQGSCYIITGGGNIDFCCYVKRTLISIYSFFLSRGLTLESCTVMLTKIFKIEKIF